MGPSRQATILSPSQSDVDFQGLNWKASVSNDKQEKHETHLQREMWGRALRLSAPTPQVYDITHKSATRQSGGARLPPPARRRKILGPYAP